MKEVAAVLGLSPRTVETHKYQVMAALGLFVLLHAAALFLWSEAILYFGHPPRREDLAIAASAC